MIEAKRKAMFCRGNANPPFSQKRMGQQTVNGGAVPTEVHIRSLLVFPTACTVQFIMHL